GLCVEDAMDGSLLFSHRIIGKQLLDWARSLPTFVARQQQCAEVKLRRVGVDPIQQHFEVSEHLFAAQQYARAWRHQVYSGRCALDLNQYHLAHDSLLRALEFLKRRPDINEQLTSAERFDARRAHV